MLPQLKTNPPNPTTKEKETVSLLISIAAEPIALPCYYCKTIMMILIGMVLIMLIHAMEIPIPRESSNKPICFRCGEWKRNPISLSLTLNPFWRRWRLGMENPISQRGPKLPHSHLLVFVPSIKKSQVSSAFLFTILFFDHVFLIHQPIIFVSISVSLIFIYKVDDFDPVKLYISQGRWCLGSRILGRSHFAHYICFYL